MARPRLEIGEWGKITVTKLPDGRYRARCRFRGLDGKVRPAEATEATRPKAERALKDRVKARVGDRDSELGGDTRLKVLAEQWWENIERRAALPHDHDEYLNPHTRIEYLRYKDYVIEGGGELALRECTPGRIKILIETRAGASSRVAAEMKRTLVGMFDHAVNMDAMDHNPAVRLQFIRGKADPARALTGDELTDMRARIHDYENGGGPDAPREPGKGRGGRPRSKYLSDVFELQLALGGRIGEVLALQWDDITGLSDDDGPVAVEIAGTLKHRSGAEAERLGLPSGLYRQEWAKTDAGHRTLTLPVFAVKVLRKLLQSRADGVPWVFATSRGTPLNPSNVRTALRKARGEEYEWVTPHTLRKTAVTTIAEATGGTQLASTFAGHSSTQITEARYIDRKQLSSDASVVLQALAPKVVPLHQSVG